MNDCIHFKDGRCLFAEAWAAQESGSEIQIATTVKTCIACTVNDLTEQPSRDRNHVTANLVYRSIPNCGENVRQEMLAVIPGEQPGIGTWIQRILHWLSVSANGGCNCGSLLAKFNKMSPLLAMFSCWSMAKEIRDSSGWNVNAIFRVAMIVGGSLLVLLACIFRQVEILTSRNMLHIRDTQTMSVREAERILRSHAI